MPTLADAVLAAPSTRAFRADPLPPELLERALRRARHAAGAWPVVVVRDAAARRAIRDAHLPHWRAHLRDSGGLRVLAADAPAGLARTLRMADHFAERLDAVPAMLVVAAEEAAGVAGFLQALAAAVRDVGLAAIEVPEASRAGAELGELLGLPDGVLVRGLLAVGHLPGGGASRDDLARAHVERWGATG